MNLNTKWLRGTFAANDISHSEGNSKGATRRLKNSRIVLLHILSKLVDLALYCDYLESVAGPQSLGEPTTMWSTNVDKEIIYIPGYIQVM